MEKNKPVANAVLMPGRARSLLPAPAQRHPVVGATRCASITPRYRMPLCSPCLNVLTGVDMRLPSGFPLQVCMADLHCGRGSGRLSCDTVTSYLNTSRRGLGPLPSESKRCIHPLSLAPCPSMATRQPCESTNRHIDRCLRPISAFNVHARRQRRRVAFYFVRAVTT